MRRGKLGMSGEHSRGDMNEGKDHGGVRGAQKPCVGETTVLFHDDDLSEPISLGKWLLEKERLPVVDTLRGLL